MTAPRSSFLGGCTWLVASAAALLALGCNPDSGSRTGSRGAANAFDVEPGKVEVWAYVFDVDGKPAQDWTPMAYKHSSYKEAGDGSDAYATHGTAVLGGKINCVPVPVSDEPLQIFQELPHMTLVAEVRITEEMVEAGSYQLPDIHLPEKSPILNNGVCEEELGERCDVHIDDCGWCGGVPPADRACNASSCATGCCDGGTCYPGTNPELCGSGGEQCVGCDLPGFLCTASSSGGGTCEAFIP